MRYRVKRERLLVPYHYDLQGRPIRPSQEDEARKGPGGDKLVAHYTLAEGEHFFTSPKDQHEEGDLYSPVPEAAKRYEEFGAVEEAPLPSSSKAAGGGGGVSRRSEKKNQQ